MSRLAYICFLSLILFAGESILAQNSNFYYYNGTAQYFTDVTVLDMSGRVLAGVTHTPHSENSYICTLDLRHLDSGLYLIRALTADGNTVSGKVVKN